MNVTLLLIDENLPEIEAFVTAVEKFKKKTEWSRAIMVVDWAMEKTGVDLANRLAPFFGETKVHSFVVGVKPAANKMMGLLAQYMTELYHTYPNEMILVDGAGVPTKANWLEIMRSHHRVGEKQFTGCFEQVEGGGMIPRGPVIFDAPKKVIKMFRYVIEPNWRLRGQWIFGRSMQQVEEKDFPFYVQELQLIPSNARKKSPKNVVPAEAAQPA